MAIPYRDAQRRVIEAPLGERALLRGPAGAGKTTAAVGRVRHLRTAGVSGETILVIVPQRILANPFLELLKSQDMLPGAEVSVITLGGLARRMAELYWPIIAGEAGFSDPDQPPKFLTLETAQFYLGRVLAPLFEAGYFQAVTVDRQRLNRQILDNLNKAALVGFPYTEIGPRLKEAWTGDPGMLRSLDQAQEAATRFREACLAHNLLDFSLQVEVFLGHAWRLPACRERLVGRFRNLIADNLEEEAPVTHDLLLDWLPFTESALLIVDEGGGYRRFLGADPESAGRLAAGCNATHAWSEAAGASSSVLALAHSLTTFGAGPGPTLTVHSTRFYPEMIEWVATTIQELVGPRGVAPAEIAVLAPYMSDSLRFALARRLELRGVRSFSHRPSRALRDEPAALGLLALACLAHPDWNLPPSREAVAQALTVSISEMDLIRARLLSQILYRNNTGLRPFGQLADDAQTRITYLLGQRYELLRTWLQARAQEAPIELDQFLGRLFGEVLSQPGFGFHRAYERAAIAANLIESFRKFREVAPELTVTMLGKEYWQLVQQGILAAQYLRSWEAQPADAVLLAPAFTFLLGNRPVSFQFWLNAGSTGWWDRPYQPLTQPYVLSRQWPRGRRWTDQDELSTRSEALERVVGGLLRRCTQGLYLAHSELGEHGTEERGPLLELVQRSLVQAAR